MDAKVLREVFSEQLKKWKLKEDQILNASIRFVEVVDSLTRKDDWYRNIAKLKDKEIFNGSELDGILLNLEHYLRRRFEIEKINNSILYQKFVKLLSFKDETQSKKLTLNDVLVLFDLIIYEGRCPAYIEYKYKKDESKEFIGPVRAIWMCHKTRNDNSHQDSNAKNLVLELYSVLMFIEAHLHKSSSNKKLTPAKGKRKEMNFDFLKNYRHYNRLDEKPGDDDDKRDPDSRKWKPIVISLVAIMVAVSLIGFAIYKAVDAFRHPSEEKRIENTEVKTSPKAEQSYQDGIRAYQDGDMAEAEKCFAKASGKGHVKAAYNLGLMYYNDGKFDDALSLFKQAADSDDRDALFYLGVMYMEGKGVLKDSAKALNYWKKAIEKGSTEAMYSVGEYYYTLKNYTEALPYFKTAASLGHAASMYILSVFYDYSLGGLPHDPSQARAWENRALANGYVPYR